MKLSKIYSNNPKIFTPIEFNDGLNVIIGKIKLHKNEDKDSHNLGKSKLADLIDFGFLKKRSNELFLFKHYDKFEHFIFYFEFKLNTGKFLTVKRSISKNTKISIKKHDFEKQDFRYLDEKGWDYQNLSIDRAKLLLDSFFNLTAISPWDYRSSIGYSLRKQNDFDDIFRLSKSRGKDINWKPFVGHILGFDHRNLKENYELTSEIEKLDEEIKHLESDIGGFQGDEEEILRDALKAKKENSEVLQREIDSFNFSSSDMKIIDDLSENIDDEIDDLNRICYYIKRKLKELKKLRNNELPTFELEKTEILFKEAGIFFGDQIKKDYEDLLEFKRKITIERKHIIEEQIEELESQLAETHERLEKLNLEKSIKLSFLISKDVSDKFKEVSRNLLIISNEIESIERKLELSEKIKKLKSDHRDKEKLKSDVIERIRDNKDDVTNSEDSIYKEIKKKFNNFVKTVLSKEGQISTKQNKVGNLEFNAGLIDEDLNFTSEADGFSYKKILCMGYDISVTLAYSKLDYIRFIYHDGGLETLDTRKKLSFLKYIRTTPEAFGVQYILTLIDSDLPSGFTFDDDEIVLELHDDGDQGLLFKMPSW